MKSKILKILNEEVTVNYSGDVVGLDDAAERINNLFQAAAEEMVKAITSKKKRNIYGDEDAMKQAVKKINIYDDNAGQEEPEWGDLSAT